jgi:NAD(P)-dependent dehydrogenase (short-subunit alcohol dehydrogenase family)
MNAAPLLPCASDLTLAVVTGAGSGIGRAIALALAGRGAELCLVGRRVEALEAVAEAARARGARVRCYGTDLALDADIECLGRVLGQEVGRLDVLVHSAGVIAPGPMEQVSSADFEAQYRTNLRAPYFLTQAVLPLLREARGQVVFINSSAGVVAKGRVGPYAATKHALKAVADSLREEVNCLGVRVLTVYAGRTATPMQAAIHELEGEPYAPERLLQPEDVAATVLAALSLPRTAEVTDISIRPMIGPGPKGG